MIPVVVVVVVLVALVLVCWHLLGDVLDRRRIARYWRDERDALPYWPRWGEDGLVTWQQAAALLPADLVDRIQHPDGYRLDNSGGRTVVDHLDPAGRPVFRHLR